MRSLIGHRPGVVVAYVLIVATTAFGFWQTQHAIDNYQHKFCILAVSVTEPIPLPPAVLPDGSDNSYGRSRTQLRNGQLAKERTDLLGDTTRC